MNKKKKLLLTCATLGLLLTEQGVQAQSQIVGGGASDAKLTPGNVASGGTIGSIYSPNLFNGSANINIPIFDYGTDAGQFGVSFSYNTSGVKVDELAGPVGLHWNLAAGGSITRVVKDMPDEMNSYTHFISELGGGSPGDPTLEEYDFGIKGKWASYLGYAGTYQYDTSRYVDGESDDFIVSVGNLSFTFNIGNNGYLFTHPRNNVKVDILLNGNIVTQMPLVEGKGNNNDNISFVIRDNQGTVYYFSQGTKELKRFDNGFGSSVLDFFLCTSWKLDKVTLPGGNEINYQYYNNGNPYAVVAGLYNSVSAVEAAAPAIFQSSSQIISPTENIISSHVLASIVYPNDVTVSFTYDSNPSQRCDNPGNPGSYYGRALREIKISSGLNCQYFQLEQAYSIAPNSVTSATELPFGTPCTNIEAQNYRFYRMVLKGIKIANCDKTKTEPYYTFGYSNIGLPPRFSGAQDYFGYFNGQSLSSANAQMTIPYHTLIYGSGTFGVDKSDNANYTAAGNLAILKNAYGGSVLFTYEGHELSNHIPGLPTDPLFMGANANDGVRLKQTIEIDPHYYSGAGGVTTNYTYSGGQRFLTGGYFHYPSAVDNSNNINGYIFGGIYVTPHQFINGANHGYSNVTLVRKDASGNTLSKQNIKYSNFYNPVTGTTALTLAGSNKQYYQQPYTDKQYIRDWEIGNVLQTEEFDLHDNIVQRTVNVYSNELDTLSTMGNIINEKKLTVIKTVPAPHLTTVASDIYRPFTGRSLLARVSTEKFFSAIESFKDTAWYTYDTKYNVKTTTVKNSRGNYHVTNNVFNYDLVGHPGLNATLNTMNNMGLEKKVSVERWYMNGTNRVMTAWKLMDAVVTEFAFSGSRLLTKSVSALQSKNLIPFPDYTGIATITSPMPVTQYHKVNGTYNNTLPAGFRRISKVTQFDLRGNPVETQFLDQDSYSASVIDSVSGNKLAEANCRLTDMAYSGFETGTKGRWNYDGANVTAHVLSAPVISGKNALRIPGSSSNVLFSESLNAGKEYLVSFWSYGGIPGLSGAGLGNIPLLARFTWGGWTYYTGKFTAANSNAISFGNSGATCYLDDVRLHPANAQMQNWNYDQLLGVSSVADVTGRISRVSYDDFGRKTIVRDQERNIISKSEFHIAQ